MGIGPGVRTRATHPKHCSIKSQKSFYHDATVYRPMYVVLVHTRPQGGQDLAFLCRFTHRERRMVIRMFRQRGISRERVPEFAMMLCAPVEGVEFGIDLDPTILAMVREFIRRHPRWEPARVRALGVKRRCFGLLRGIDFFGEHPYNIETIKQSKRSSNGNRKSDRERFFREIFGLLYSSD